MHFSFRKRTQFCNRIEPDPLGYIQIHQSWKPGQEDFIAHAMLQVVKCKRVFYLLWLFCFYHAEARHNVCVWSSLLRRKRRKSLRQLSLKLYKLHHHKTDLNIAMCHWPQGMRLWAQHAGGYSPRKSIPLLGRHCETNTLTGTKSKSIPIHPNIRVLQAMGVPP